MTKTAKKNILFGAAHTYMGSIGGIPPPHRAAIVANEFVIFFIAL